MSLYFQKGQSTIFIFILGTIIFGIGLLFNRQIAQMQFGNNFNTNFTTEQPHTNIELEQENSNLENQQSESEENIQESTFPTQQPSIIENQRFQFQATNTSPGVNVSSGSKTPEIKKIIFKINGNKNKIKGVVPTELRIEAKNFENFDSLIPRLVLKNLETQRVIFVGSFEFKESNKYVFDFDSRLYKNGRYLIYAELEFDGKIYLSDKININIENIITPPVFINIKGNINNLKDNVKIELRVEDADEVTLFLRRKEGLVDILVDRMEKEDKDLWKLELDTTNFPNGNYFVFARVKNIYGSYESDKISIVINNIEPEERVKEAEKKVEELLSKKGEQIEKKLEETSKKLSKEFGDKEDKKEQLQKKIEQIREKFDDEAKKVKEVIKKSEEEKLKPSEERVSEERVKEEKIKEKIEIAQEKIEERFKEIKEKKEKRTEIALEKREKELEKQKELERKKEKIEQVSKKLEDAFEKLEKEIEDFDNDGIPNILEIELYKTDPFEADSDKDGFIDGLEILNGFSPTIPSPSDKIIFEEPTEKGIERPDIYKIEEVKLKVEKDEEGKIKKKELVLKGKALPNSFVTIYIYSLNPIILVVKTDEFGNWQYVLEKDIGEGEHTVYVALTDNSGRIIEKSKPLKFIQEAEAVTLLDVEKTLKKGEISQKRAGLEQTKIQDITKDYIFIGFVLTIIALIITLIVLVYIVHKFSTKRIKM